MRTWFWIVPALTVALTAVAVSKAAAGGDICHRLWVERNEIYKAHGYCFQSWRARSYFGNHGCAYWSEYDAPLSWGASARVADIVDREHAYGCRWPGY